MKSLFSICILMTYFFIGGIAIADQCVWLERDAQKHIWKSAEKLLKKSDNFIEFCEPCQQKYPGAIQAIHSVETSIAWLKGNNGKSYIKDFMIIEVNGAARDLAYTYVQTGLRVFTNLAILVGCPVSDVSPLLYIEAGKKVRPVSWEELSTGNTTPSR